MCDGPTAFSTSLLSRKVGRRPEAQELEVDAWEGLFGMAMVLASFITWIGRRPNTGTQRSQAASFWQDSERNKNVTMCDSDRVDEMVACNRNMG